MQGSSSAQKLPSAHGQTQLKHFIPICKLGEGAFSTVYKVKRINDDQIYALKKIKMQKLKPKQQQNALNQIRILASIKSKHIVSYKQAFYDVKLGLLCIVMEYANNGDLQKKVVDAQKTKIKFNQSQIWKAAGEILIGLYILHEKGILHRDLKSANIFISDGFYKLGDLNVSKVNQEKDQLARTQTGTPYYASPQVWMDQPYNNKCDIWSYGCLLYQMCTLNPPFKGTDLDDLFQKIQRGKYSPIPCIYSAELASLIKRCLVVNPQQRASTIQLLEQFPKLKWKFLQAMQKADSKNILMNTIKLPCDMRDLSKSLPIAEYGNSICENISQPFPTATVKQAVIRLYSKKEQKSLESITNTQNSTHLQIKNIETIESQQPDVKRALPQRIKDHFIKKSKQNFKIKKRPDRPSTCQAHRSRSGIKRPMMTIPDQKQKKITDESGERQSKPPVTFRKKLLTKAGSSNLIINSQQKPSSLLTAHKKSTKLIENNCSSIKSSKKQLPSDNKHTAVDNKPVPMNKQKNYSSSKSSSARDRNRSCSSAAKSIKSKQRSTSKSRQNLSHRQRQSRLNGSIKKTLSLNNRSASKQAMQIVQTSLKQCKQDGLRRISSMEKKGQYLRNYRKQRKQLFTIDRTGTHTITNKQMIAQHNELLLDMKYQLSNKIRQRQGQPLRQTASQSMLIAANNQSNYHINRKVTHLNNQSQIFKKQKIRHKNDSKNNNSSFVLQDITNPNSAANRVSISADGCRRIHGIQVRTRSGRSTRKHLLQPPQSSVLQTIDDSTHNANAVERRIGLGLIKRVQVPIEKLPALVKPTVHGRGKQNTYNKREHEQEQQKQYCQLQRLRKNIKNRINPLLLYSRNNAQPQSRQAQQHQQRSFCY